MGARVQLPEEEQRQQLAASMSAAFFRDDETTAFALMETARALPFVGTDATVHSDYALVVDAFAARAYTYGGAHVRTDKLRFLHDVPTRGWLQVLWVDIRTRAHYDLAAASVVVANDNNGGTLVLSVPLLNLTRTPRNLPRRPEAADGGELRDAKLYLVLHKGDPPSRTYDVSAVHVALTWKIGPPALLSSTR